MAAALRPYSPSDIDALRLVCLRTAAAGGDATGLVSDPDLPGDVFAVPFAVFAPEAALVLVDGGGLVVGYVVAAPDTTAFEARCETDWWPPLRQKYPVDSGTRPLDDLFIGVIHDPPRAAVDVVATYPSHLHLNLLADVHGGGWGRRMIESIADVLVARGSRGIHLGVDPANQPAQRFYERVGFDRLDTSDGQVLYGMSLAGR